MALRIGEMLVREQLITPLQLQEAVRHQKASGGEIGLILVKLGYVKDQDITALLSRQYGVPSVKLSEFDIDEAVIELIPPETARKYQVVPINRFGSTLTIAMTDPTNVFAVDELKAKVRDAVEHRQLREENAALKKAQVHAGDFQHIIGESTVIRELKERIRRGGRGPFVAVNCGALPETLLESETIRTRARCLYRG